MSKIIQIAIRDNDSKVYGLDDEGNLYVVIDEFGDTAHWKLYIKGALL